MMRPIKLLANKHVRNKNFLEKNASLVIPFFHVFEHYLEKNGYIGKITSKARSAKSEMKTSVDSLFE